jgi:hypothetical protein
MESPFYQTNRGGGGDGGCNGSIVTTMYLEPILNSYYQTYQNVITLSSMPAGPLRDMVSMINPPKLSEWATASPFYSNPGYGRGPGGAGCVYVLLRYPIGRGGVSGYSAFSKSTDMAMGNDDIPAVLNYLTVNGYTVDTKLTRMLQNSDVNIGGPAELRLSGNRRLICMFTYQG